MIPRVPVVTLSRPVPVSWASVC